VNTAATVCPSGGRTLRIEPLKDLLINDNGFAFDPRAGLTYTISPTGLDIVRGLKAGVDREGILEDLLGRYEVDAATAADDCDEFLRCLERLHLIERGDA
jgi:Coenzyme PQQ synthesis protein D (PqqD)